MQLHTRQKSLATPLIWDITDCNCIHFYIPENHTNEPVNLITCSSAVYLSSVVSCSEIFVLTLDGRNLVHSR